MHGTVNRMSKPETQKFRPLTTGRTGSTRRAATVALGRDMADRPEVRASARGRLAERMLELAFAHDVKVREDAELAEMLAALDEDADIPTEALIPIAEIFSYLYRLNGEADVPQPDHPHLTDPPASDQMP
ncbi:MAG: hypothetical protein Alpg2KO_11690 [Alphaproteobacteria bacterium]